MTTSKLSVDSRESDEADYHFYSDLVRRSPSQLEEVIQVIHVLKEIRNVLDVETEDSDMTKSKIHGYLANVKGEKKSRYNEAIMAIGKKFLVHGEKPATFVFRVYDKGNSQKKRVFEENLVKWPQGLIKALSEEIAKPASKDSPLSGHLSNSQSDVDIPESTIPRPSKRREFLLTEGVGLGSSDRSQMSKKDQPQSQPGLDASPEASPNPRENPQGPSQQPLTTSEQEGAHLSRRRVARTRSAFDKWHSKNPIRTKSIAKKWSSILGVDLLDGITTSRMRREENDAAYTNTIRLHFPAKGGSDFKLEVWLCASTGECVEESMSSAENLRGVIGKHLFDAMESSVWRNEEQKAGLSARTGALLISFPYGHNSDCKLEMMLCFGAGRELYYNLFESGSTVI